MAESKKGHNFAIQGPTEEKNVFAYFCTVTVAIYKISSSLLKRFSDGPKLICPITSSKLGA